MRGVVDGDAADPHALGRERLEQRVERVGLAGDDDAARAVDGRHGESVGQLQRVDVEGDRGHPALAGEAFGDGLAAQGDDAGGVLEREGAGDVGGGDLALGVPDDRAGLDAVRAPQRGERDHHGPQRGLDDIDALEVGAALA